MGVLWAKNVLLWEKSADCEKNLQSMRKIWYAVSKTWIIVSKIWWIVSKIWVYCEPNVDMGHFYLQIIVCMFVTIYAKTQKIKESSLEKWTFSLTNVSNLWVKYIFCLKCESSMVCILFFQVLRIAGISIFEPNCE